jgi:hypothetical protein
VLVKLKRSQELPETPKEDLYKDSNSMTFLQTMTGSSTAVVVGDYHAPYQDSNVTDLVRKFIVALKPLYLIFNGDLTDFYQVSSYSKDPSRIGQLQTDLNITTNMLYMFRKALPRTEIYLLDGTHEVRWQKYLQEKAPAVSGLTATTIEQLYTLNDLGIHHVGYERGLLINKTFMITHGDIALKHSSWTAKALYERHGGSGMCNHTHRGGSYYVRNRFGTYGWWENFCLCTLNPDWTQNPNWQQGFSVVSFQDNGRFFVEQIPIIDNKFIYGGTLYA